MKQLHPQGKRKTKSATSSVHCEIGNGLEPIEEIAHLSQINVDSD